MIQRNGEKTKGRKNSLIFNIIRFSVLFFFSLSPSIWAQKNTPSFVFVINGDSNFYTESSSGLGGLKNSTQDDLTRIKKILNENKNISALLVYDSKKEGLDAGKTQWILSQKGTLSSIASQDPQHSTPAPYKRTHFRRSVTSSRLKEGPGNFPSELNLSDAKSWTHILTEASRLLETSNLHLIYIGHGPFDNSNEKSPFDHSHPKDSFSSSEFVSAIREASRNGAVLSSVTLASCEGASLRLAVELAEETEHLVASEVKLLKSQESYFDFSILSKVDSDWSSEEISKALARSISRPTSQTDSIENLRERPMSYVSLKDLLVLKDDLEDFLHDVERLPSDALSNAKALLGPANGGFSKSASDLYLKLFAFHESPSMYDFGLLVEVLGSYPSLRDFLAKDSIMVFNGSELQKKSGLYVNKRISL